MTSEPSTAIRRSDVDSDSYGLRSQVPVGARVALSTNEADVIAAALIVLDGWADEVLLVPPGSPVKLDAGVMRISPSAPGTSAATAPRTHVTTKWVLFTSGTTGEPKPITHTTESLTRTVNAAATEHVWGLLYDPNRMAGVQVILQALRSDAPLVAPPLDEPLGTRIATMIRDRVTAMSATPSLWRQILQLPVARDWPLRQITLGGEIADQRVLDAIATTFPDARVVHVFASTETGAAFSVRDGLEGFPSSYLESAPRGIRLEVRDGILHVHSPGASAAGPDGFASTGDVVELLGDRVLFRGRSSGVVNVGGSNVWPEVVEAILRTHPAVVEAVVTARPNPMTGNVLIADVTIDDAHEPVPQPKELRSWVRQRAPRTHVPATISICDTLSLAPTGKIIR